MTREEAVNRIENVEDFVIRLAKDFEKRDYEAFDMAIKALKQPIHKKGKWITNPNKMKGTEIECNKCGVSALSKIGIQVCSDFCPNCGADMRGSEE